METTNVLYVDDSVQGVSGGSSRDVDDLLASQEGGVDLHNSSDYTHSRVADAVEKGLNGSLETLLSGTQKDYKHPHSRIVAEVEEEVMGILESLRSGENLSLAQLVEAGIKLDIAMTIVSTVQKAWTNMHQMMQKTVQ